jgi:hypothetical protein
MPAKLRAELERSARESDRSLSAEIRVRLVATTTSSPSPAPTTPSGDSGEGKSHRDRRRQRHRLLHAARPRRRGVRGDRSESVAGPCRLPRRRPPRRPPLEPGSPRPSLSHGVLGERGGRKLEARAYEESDELEPPSAEHVEAVYRTSRPCIGWRCSGSTGRVPGSRASTRPASATTTRPVAECVSVPRPRSLAAPSGSSFPRHSPTRSSRGCRHARIATPRRGSSPAPGRTRSERRSRRRAGRWRSRSGRRTTCATAASRCCTSRGAGPGAGLGGWKVSISSML